MAHMWHWMSPFIDTRVVQKVLSLIGFLIFIQVYFKMLHCTWMVCWIANDTHLFRANCFPTDRVILNWNSCSHIHWPIYLLHWHMNLKTKIRSYIKCRIRLNIDSKQIFNEMCGIYGPQTISMRTGFRWVKAFKAGKFSVEDDTRPGRPKTSVTKANIAAVKIVVEQDARLSVKDITKICCTQFSLIQVGQSFKCLVHLIIQSLADSTRILYWRKWKSFTIRNDQAKDGQESTFYMTTPPLISVRLLSLFRLLKRWKF